MRRVTGHESFREDRWLLFKEKQHLHSFFILGAKVFMMRKRVVITGVGMISAVGLSIEENWGNLAAGESGAGSITRFEASGFDCTAAAEVNGFDPKEYIKDRKSLKLMSESVQYALAASEMAMSDAGLKMEALEPEKIGVFTGSGNTGLDISLSFPAFDVFLNREGEIDYGRLGSEGLYRLDPLFLLKTLPNSAPCYISVAHNAQGPMAHFVQYGVSGAQAIGEGFRTIQRGNSDIVIAAAGEFLSISSFLTYYPFGILTSGLEPKRACRPFDDNRDGFLIGEGAGALILEELSHARKRKASVLAELVGYGNAADAYHLLDVPDDGGGTSQAIINALLDAELGTEDIDYMNLHGNATIRNDRTETAAIKKVFGESAYRVPTSSTKPITGHLLAASGPVELIICILVIKKGFIPPTINHEYPSPDCDLNYTPNIAAEAKVDVALSINRGIGGQNTALIVKRCSE
ncbi:MAG: beta-ketoacyl-[acyl-carrier-protein] synthase family protein [Promethearchaeota archaeon]